MGLITGLPILETTLADTTNLSGSEYKWLHKMIGYLLHVHNEASYRYTRSCCTNTVIEILSNFLGVLFLPLISSVTFATIIKVSHTAILYILKSSDLIFAPAFIALMCGLCAIFSVTLYKCVIFSVIQLSIGLQCLYKLRTVHKDNRFGTVYKLAPEVLTEDTSNLLLEWNSYD